MIYNIVPHEEVLCKLRIICDKLGTEIEITERDEDICRRGIEKYYASLKSVEIKKNRAILASAFGNGNTKEEALLDLLNLISGKHLVFDAYGENRKELNGDGSLRVDGSKKGDDNNKS
ncbi:MAG: hypothetical protein M0R03_23400 [Novosphingobium sp.]|nr:hypothetical protein [Novosphingobium sp.]